MPNDCSNNFTVSKVTADQWQQLADSFQVRGEGYQQDFLKTFFPEPDWQNTPNKKGHLPGPSYMSSRGYQKRGFVFPFGDLPALTPKTVFAESPVFPDGTTDQRWYDWRIDNWGTKWDIYNCFNEFEEPSDSFSVSFQTAWSPLNEKCMEVLSKQFPGAVLTNSYDEEGDDFCGVTVAKDGVVLDYCTEISKLKESWAKENHPGLWEEAENPEDEDAVDELFDLWCDEMGEVVYDHLDAKEDELIEQVLKQVSFLTTTPPVEVG
ncbi:hypothetical protein SynRS9907_00832 [Synechococcus sp. RS9907]|uniref:DUF1281 family ferredoxin-like fold protein n=1 Tax=Synechococcus sp. RS9907 TaxID=221350 RepID=UPI00165E3C82|nr:hypothetical protein [Synechococcus sp. RS9907]QNI81684.1 hypothetical protein SynRS9907_00832 [Synechococcus sp. RS9907]